MLTKLPRDACWEQYRHDAHDAASQATDRRQDLTLQTKRFSTAAHTPRHAQLHVFTDVALADDPYVSKQGAPLRTVNR